MRRCIIYLLAVIFLASCAEPSAETLRNDTHNREFFAMDTYITLMAHGENAEAALEEIEAIIYNLEYIFSVTNEHGGAVYALNNYGQAALWEFGDLDAFDSLRQWISTAREATDGAFNPMLYPVMSAWGFYSGKYRVPGGDELENLLELTRARLEVPPALARTQPESQVRFDIPGAGVDFGAVLKGHAADLAVGVLREHGVESALLNLGGDVYAHGARPDGTPWRVGVTDPHNPDAYAAILHVTDRAVFTSGDYIRYFELDGTRYHHIIDPATGYPANSGIASVTVVGDNSTYCDALSTALFVMGYDRVAENWRNNRCEYEAIVVTNNGEIAITDGLVDVLSTDRPYTIIER